MSGDGGRRAVLFQAVEPGQWFEYRGSTCRKVHGGDDYAIAVTQTGREQRVRVPPTALVHAYPIEGAPT
jgi:hypothetical protein